jgi:hypothetical protein
MNTAPFYQVCTRTAEVANEPLSPQFDTKDEADQALAGLVDKHPDARVWRYEAA